MNPDLKPASQAEELGNAATYVREALLLYRQALLAQKENHDPSPDPNPNQTLP